MLSPSRNTWIVVIAAVVALLCVLGAILVARTPRRDSASQLEPEGQCSPVTRPVPALSAAATAERARAQTPPAAAFAASGSPPAISAAIADPNVLHEIAREEIIRAQADVARLDLRIAMFEASGRGPDAEELRGERQLLLEQIAAMRQEAGIPADESSDADSLQ